MALKTRIVDAIVTEIQISKHFTTDENIETIYFGGGTPSLLTEAELKKIFASLYTYFTIDPGAEITFEANPDNIDAESLQMWKQIGINRLSVGIQSFINGELIWMNRAHSAEDSIKCINYIENAGFSNYSVDLIYGSPLLTDEDLINNISYIIRNNIPHISCYALTVEPKTRLDSLIARKKSPAIDNDKQSAQFLIIMQILKDAGYEHYEISNFCKPGMRSRHNSSYWNGTPYYGFGPSAHSYNGRSRFWNVANNSLYLSSIEKGEIPVTEELLTPVQQLNEMIMISLRTSEGLDLNVVEERFSKESAKNIIKRADKFRDPGYITLTNSKIILTNEGKLLADGIASDLFFMEGAF